MALFKISKGLAKDLPQLYTEGFCYFTTDDGKFYIDTTNEASGRIALNSYAADRLHYPRKISLDGALKGETTFDGSQDVTINISEVLANQLAEERIINLTGDVTGSVKFDGSKDISLITTVNIDASKVTSGVFDIKRIPQGALERLVVVQDENAKFELTIAEVQLGDVVKVVSSGLMYYVIDTNNLDNALGYEVFSAGRASSVNWENIENSQTLVVTGDAEGEVALGGRGVGDKKVLNLTLKNSGVTSINGQTGDVILSALDVGAVYIDGEDSELIAMNINALVDKRVDEAIAKMRSELGLESEE